MCVCACVMCMCVCVCVSVYVRVWTHLEREREGESDGAGVDGVALQDDEECGEEDDEITERLPDDPDPAEQRADDAFTSST